MNVMDVLYVPSALMSFSSKPLLSLQQILHQRFVKTDASIHRHIIDVSFRAFGPIKIAKLLDRPQIVAAYAARVHHQLGVILDILKLDSAVKGKMDLGLVEDVEDDDLVAAMPQMVHPFQNRAVISQ